MYRKPLNQVDFKLLERSHDNLYPQIGSKPISNLLSSIGLDQIGLESI